MNFLQNIFIKSVLTILFFVPLIFMGQYSVGVPIQDTILLVPENINNLDTNCTEISISYSNLDNYLTGVNVSLVLSDISTSGCLCRMGYGFVNTNDTINVNSSSMDISLSGACDVDFNIQTIIHGTPLAQNENYYCNLTYNISLMVDGCALKTSYNFYPDSPTKDCSTYNSQDIENNVMSCPKISQFNDHWIIEDLTPFQVSIYSISGKKIYDGQNNLNHSIDTKLFPKGMYIIQMANSKNYYTKKLIK